MPSAVSAASSLFPQKAAVASAAAHQPAGTSAGSSTSSSSSSSSSTGTTTSSGFGNLLHIPKLFVARWTAAASPPADGGGSGRGGVHRHLHGRHNQHRRHEGWGRPLTERPVDAALAVALAALVPLMLLVDAEVLLPSSALPDAWLDASARYVYLAGDFLVREKADWFKSIAATRVLLHLPFVFYAIWSLVTDPRPDFRFPALAYASHVVATAVPVVGSILLSDELEAWQARLLVAVHAAWPVAVAAALLWRVTVAWPNSAAAAPKIAERGSSKLWGPKSE
ncbi:hypothetical protein DFJ73DRAFT_795774 [Zopfochytrium polystomum]|nr:hypothetical protein DFJ73DRAFT_795774 [Zopfochytrium polystomum]